MTLDYKRDTEYWNKYYSRQAENISEHSLFAEFVWGYLKEKDRLLEIGCGNGRDSIWFSEKNMFVSCIDASDIAIGSIRKANSKIHNLVCGDFVNSDIYTTNTFDAVYSRFSIHSINDQQEQVLLKNVYQSLSNEGIFAIEVRSINDELYKKGKQVGRNAYIYNNHYRRFIEINELIINLIRIGFVVQYAEENKGFAPFENENPYVIRVIVKKINESKQDV